jgi:hypothetical protein
MFCVASLYRGLMYGVCDKLRIQFKYIRNIPSSQTLYGHHKNNTPGTDTMENSFLPQEV